MPWMTEALFDSAKDFFRSRGMTVSEGTYLRECDDNHSTSIEHRLADLHEAFADPTVTAILAIRGGWNCNQLLPFLDYDLIKKNPKIFCGFSDITALGNAILAKTGLVTYSGPNFNQFSFGDKIAYTYDHFLKAVMDREPIEIIPSKEWTDSYFSAEKPWEFRANEGFWAVQEGKAEGTIIGGNLCTLSLLQGTQYMPESKDVILFVEDDHETHPRTFDRDLTSLTQQPWFDSVRGVVFGRCQSTAVNQEFGPVTKEKLFGIIRRNAALKNLPIIGNADFGHTYPIFTFPIGGTATMSVHGKESKLTIADH